MEQYSFSRKAAMRRRQFEDCMIANLQRMPYSSISVSDLVEQCGVSRRAFYCHYQDKDACFCAVLKQIYQEIMLCVSETDTCSSTSLEATTAVMDFWKTQKWILDIIVNNNLMHLMMRSMFQFVQEEANSIKILMKTSDVNVDEDVLAAYLSGQMALIFRWRNRGFDTPPEEIAKKYLWLIKGSAFTK